MAKKNKGKKRFLKPREWENVSDRWVHIIGFLYENRKRIIEAGLSDEVEFLVGNEMIVIKK